MDLVVRECAGKRGLLRLPFDIHRHREAHFTRVRRRSVRDLSCPQRAGDRSSDALSLLLQRQTDRAVALTQVDHDGPRSGKRVATGTTAGSWSKINRTPINKHMRDAT